MAEETVTVGDTEVQITETDDGFEVEPAETDPEPGLYLRVESNDPNSYGFEIPLGGNYEVKSCKFGSYKAAWDTDEDVSDMRDHGNSNDLGEHSWDGEATIAEIEIVEY